MSEPVPFICMICRAPAHATLVANGQPDRYFCADHAPIQPPGASRCQSEREWRRRLEAARLDFEAHVIECDASAVADRAPSSPFSYGLGCSLSADYFQKLVAAKQILKIVERL